MNSSHVRRPHRALVGMFWLAAVFGVSSTGVAAEIEFQDAPGSPTAISAAGIGSGFYKLKAFSKSETSRLERILVAQTELPPVDPYTWSAALNENGTIILNGYVPSVEIQQSILSEAGEHAMDATSLARGAPESFSQNSSRGLIALGKLTEGQIKYDSQGWKISGIAPSASVRDGIAADLVANGESWSISLEVAETNVGDTPAATGDEALPQADPYLWAAERASDGSFAFTGNVPAPQLQKYLKVRAADVTSDTTIVADGAPDDFVQSLLAGFDVLSSLEEGRLAYTGSEWAISGRAESAEAKDRLVTGLAAAIEVSDWRIGIDSPPAQIEPYVWSVNKTEDGGIGMSGYVPTSQLHRFLSVRAGQESRNNSLVGPGAPEGFVSDALAALEALRSLESGDAGYDGNQWYIKGMVESEQGREAVVAALGISATPSDLWKLKIELVEPEPEPAIEQAVAPVKPPTTPPPPPPYPFAARKTDAGIIMSGKVPADAMRRYLSVIANGAASDGLRIEASPPEGFINTTVAGVRALGNLKEGRLRHGEGGWSLSGIARDEAARNSVLAAIGDMPITADITLVPPRELCAENLETLSEENGILFAPASARITPDSSVTIDHVVAILNECPETAIHVEGHTDADGDEQANLMLSLARSEAVIAELLERGISDTRLYAVAYGESLPIASNATAAGKQRNRRIVFGVAPERE